MTDNLIERLRDYVEHFGRSAPNVVQPIAMAADRIEKLEAVLKKMTCTCLYNCMEDINQICSDFEARHVLEGK